MTTPKATNAANQREVVSQIATPEFDARALKTWGRELVAETDTRVEERLVEIHRVTDNSQLLARRRKEIVTAAYETLTLEGFHATSVSEIAERAGIDKRTLYDYVGSKEDILYLLFLHYLPIQLKRLAGALREEGSPRDQLRNLMHEHVNFINDHPGLALLAYREMRYLHREQVSHVLRIIDQIMRLYETVIACGVADGTMTCEHPRIAAHAVRATLDMPGLSAWDLNRFQLIDVETSIARTVLDGLSARQT